MSDDPAAAQGPLPLPHDLEASLVISRHGESTWITEGRFQGAADPPTFTLFTNRELPRTYLRFVENQLRDAFDLGATPIKVRVRRRTS